jgi:hypothetical protein
LFPGLAAVTYLHDNKVASRCEKERWHGLGETKHANAVSVSTTDVDPFGCSNFVGTTSDALTASCTSSASALIIDIRSKHYTQYGPSWGILRPFFVCGMVLASMQSILVRLKLLMLAVLWFGGCYAVMFYVAHFTEIQSLILAFLTVNGIIGYRVAMTGTTSATITAWRPVISGKSFKRSARTLPGTASFAMA